MRALVIHCHPSPESFTAAVRDRVVAGLRRGGAEVEVLDLYAEGFDPVMTRHGWEHYESTPANRTAVADHAAAVRRSDALVFVYPTWWYGQPAVLKGWLERVLVPDVAFSNPCDGPIRPGLTHVRTLAAFTTCGASRRLTWLVGAPGRRTLMRGLRFLCHPRCAGFFAAHYSMDASTPATRARHFARVDRTVARMLRRARAGDAATAAPDMGATA